MIEDMNKSEKANICSQCISLWGITAQMIMVIEELLELALAVCRYYRGRATTDDVAGEIADVNIMNMQLAYMLSVPQESIDKWETIKIERLKKRLASDAEKRNGKDL